MNCSRCTNPAKWNLEAVSKMWKLSKLSCDLHKELVELDVQKEAAKIEKMSGNQNYPEVVTPSGFSYVSAKLI